MRFTLLVTIRLWKSGRVPIINSSRLSCPVNQRLGFGLAPEAFSAEALFLTDRQPTVIFVWITVFNFFAVPPEFQKRVLLYGVLGAIAMRAVLIYLGALLLAESHWIFYLFGLFLLLTGLRMLFAAKHEPEVEKNPVLGWMRRHLKITRGLRGEAFFVVEDGCAGQRPCSSPWFWWRLAT